MFFFSLFLGIKIWVKFGPKIAKFVEFALEIFF
jgi:hypothetical protein